MYTFHDICQCGENIALGCSRSMILFDTKCKNHPEIFEMPLRNYWGMCSNFTNIPENGSEIAHVCLCSEQDLTANNVLDMFYWVHFAILTLKFHVLVNSFSGIFIFFNTFFFVLLRSFIYLAIFQSKIDRVSQIIN